ncbi:MAG: SulP family inorganic anion transporter, partial [Candidatus Hydrogenedentota bacterium]
MSSVERTSKQELLENILAGLTVSFVAISLGAAFGLLSGRGAFAGMISAGLIATVTALLGGTRVQCSGPTGPMTAVTAVLVAKAYERFSTELPDVSPDHAVNITIMMMAALILVFAVLRLGKFAAYVPNVVVSGFMNGIAIIIWVDQFKKLFGWGGQTRFEGSYTQNILLFAGSLVIIFTIPKFTRRFLPKFQSLLSATILTLIIATAIAYVLGLDVERVQLTSSLKSPGDFSDLVAAHWPTNWSSEVLRFAFPFALQLAFLAYLDTLLTSLVVDKMTGESTKPNKELVAQGVAGGLVALVGGIPGAQATIRSVLIVNERATMRLAGVLVGVFALVEMVLFQDTINLIPQAV